MSHVSQIDLISAITRHLERRWPKGINPRQLNAITEAAALIVAAFNQEHRPAAPGMGLVAWLKSDETGLSSLAVAWRLAPLVRMGPRLSQLADWVDAAEHHPLDPSDFGRIIGLLDAAPELRPHLPAMAGASPEWAALIEHWEELEALYREELPSGKAPRLYARMRGLCEAAGAEKTTEGERS